MTYCLAWRTKREIHMIADSVVSWKEKQFKPTTPKSSFNERHKVNDKYFTEEKFLKLFKIREDVILCFAGYNDTILEIVDTLKKCLNEYGIGDLKSAFELAINSIRPITKENHVTILLGYINNEQKLELLSFGRTAELEIIKETDDLIQIGSPPEKFKEQITKLVEIVKNNIDEEYQVITLLSFLQSYGQLSDLMKMYVGGAFCSISLTDKGVKWMDDTTYILYDFLSKPHYLERVIVGIREDSIIVFSTMESKRNAIFRNEEFLHKEEALKLQNVAIEFTRSGKSKYYSFISKRSMKITVVLSNYLLKNDYFETSRGIEKFIPSKENKVIWFDLLILHKLDPYLKDNQNSIIYDPDSSKQPSEGTYGLEIEIITDVNYT